MTQMNIPTDSLRTVAGGLADKQVPIRNDWSGQPIDPNKHPQKLLTDIFDATAKSRPKSVAVDFDGELVTYEELDRRANNLARYLKALGVGPGSFVGLLVPRTVSLYVGMLGILKAGAAYVPIDPSFPDDRTRFILDDCSVAALVTLESHERTLGLSIPVVSLDSDEYGVAASRISWAPGAEISLEQHRYAYVIYTSGTTGRPKGVPISHRNVCSFVHAEAQVFGVHSGDRVYQGFSIAFDASVEEIWLAFASGATLVPATEAMANAGPELAKYLTLANITVLSCVPTLLAMISDDIPSVRLLILGGEACPQSLVERWWRPSRRLVNSYGPTEATVVATYTDLHPEKPVTIGRPLSNTHCFVLDEFRKPVAVGVDGELYLGGTGISDGYLNRPELTSEKFVPNPFAASRSDTPTLYRTGDLVRYTGDGELEFLGRIDGQVKLRGFRIELSEVEAVLLRGRGIRAAAVTLREDRPGLRRLVGYVVPKSAEHADEDELKAILRTQLPGYMVPATIEFVHQFPTLPSGKIDRKSLPMPRPRDAESGEECASPTTETERQLCPVWAEVLGTANVSRQADLFFALGGDSLLAAILVSKLRKMPGFEAVSMPDLYRNPTIEQLGVYIDQTQSRQPGIAKRPTFAPSKRVSQTRYVAFAAAQAIGLYFVFGLFSLQWLAPFLAYAWLDAAGHAFIPSALAALASLLGLYPAMLCSAIAAKWLIIGRFKSGTYPLFGSYHFRVWLVNQIVGVVPVEYLTGSPLLNWFYRLMGAKIGKRVYLATDNLGVFDLVSIGDDTSIGHDSSFNVSYATNGHLHLHPIDVGKHCYVGTRSILSDDVILGNDSRLEDLSLLSRGSRVPDGETWRGSPAKLSGPAITRGVAVAPEKPGARAWATLLQLLGSFIFPVFILAAVLPGVVIMHALEDRVGDYYLLASPLVAVTFILILATEIVVVKWLLLGRIRAGRYPLSGGFFARKWFVDHLMELSLDVLGPMYATLFLAPWYRLLGCNLGKNAEISTAEFTSPDLLHVGDESFVADGVSLGAPHVEDGMLTLAETRVGKRAFIGNSAVLPAGHTVGDDCLIGVLSMPPIEQGTVTESGTSWLGSPAMFLPQRSANHQFADDATYKPPRRLYFARAAVEVFRITLPVTAYVLLTSILVDWVTALRARYSIGSVILSFPLLYVACAIALCLFVVAAKWVLMGRYRSGEKPLWSAFVWFNELVTALHEHIANALLVETLTGTPYAAWFFRLMGSKIGARVYLETTQFTEYDLIQIGDDACINEDCTLQTHLFEDRVMKMSTVSIGAHCTVGSASVVLYDSKMEPGSYLDHLSLLAKGEVLPAASAWVGSPAQNAGHIHTQEQRKSAN